MASDRSHSVREVALPWSARVLTTLPRVDYTDAFVLATSRSRERTAEEWARAMLEDAPQATQTMLRRGWFALGIRLGSPHDRRRVLGWAVRRSLPDHALLAARSRFGFDAELLFKREHGAVLFATLIKLNNPLTRTFWAGFSPQHRRVVRDLLEQASRRVA